MALPFISLIRAGAFCDRFPRSSLENRSLQATIAYVELATIATQTRAWPNTYPMEPWMNLKTSLENSRNQSSASPSSRKRRYPASR